MLALLLSLLAAITTFQQKLAVLYNCQRQAKFSALCPWLTTNGPPSFFSSLTQYENLPILGPPRGSQSGREKRRDESFQVWAKEPLGTDSHRTISKDSSGCRLLIGHKKCFVLLCPIGEQGTFGMLSAGAILFAPRIFCFWRITMYRK